MSSRPPIGSSTLVPRVVIGAGRSWPLARRSRSPPWMRRTQVSTCNRCCAVRSVGRRAEAMVSLLDIIGPVMVGPSSSHTAGACRLGLLARCLVGGTPERARVELHGSFARTGEGHGTDKAIVGGLLG